MADEQTGGTPPAEDVTGLKAALAAEREARKAAETEAKRTKTLEDELAAERAKTATDAEKALAAAKREGETEGRAAALRDLAPQLVGSELRAATAGRMTVEQLDALLENVDSSKFVNKDGAVDRAALTGWVDKIAPAPATPPTDDKTKQPTLQRLPVAELKPGAAPASGPVGALGSAESYAAAFALD